MAFRLALLVICFQALTGNSLAESSLPKLVFVKKHTNTHYAKMMMTLPDITEFTLCYWFNAHEIDVKHHFFSYSGRKKPDSLLTWIEATPGQSENATLGVTIADGKAEMNVIIPRNKLYNKWAHVCFSWSSWCLQGMIHLNGVALPQRKVTLGHIQHVTELTITTGGVVVLGQDQDVYGGGFEKKDAYIGELQGVQLWDEKLAEYDIRKVKTDTSVTGNLISWMYTSMLLRDVAVEHFSLPKY